MKKVNSNKKENKKKERKEKRELKKNKNKTLPDIMYSNCCESSKILERPLHCCISL